MGADHLALDVWAAANADRSTRCGVSGQPTPNACVSYRRLAIGCEQACNDLLAALR
ncbi:MAG TPA: hypothetical protein VF486_22825 [Actinomycetes bacterium]